MVIVNIKFIQKKLIRQFERQMLVLPWYIRLTIDCVIISTPFLYINKHPTTHLFEYFQNKRRIGRRLTPEELGDNMNENATQNLAQSKQLYKKLGMEY